MLVKGAPEMSGYNVVWGHHYLVTVVEVQCQKFDKNSNFGNSEKKNAKDLANN